MILAPLLVRLVHVLTLAAAPGAPGSLDQPPPGVNQAPEPIPAHASATAPAAIPAVVPVVPAAPAAGPSPDETATPMLFSVGMLIQTRYQQTDVNISPGLEALVRYENPNPSISSDALRLIRDTARTGDGLRLRRAFLNFAGNPMAHLDYKVQLDLAQLLDPVQPAGLGLLREAYGRLTPADEIAVTVGVVQIPFSLSELVEFEDLELAEMGPTHELLQHLGFIEGDIGAMADISPFSSRKRLHITAGAFANGSTGGQDYRGPGLLALRLLTEPIDHLRLGAGIVWRPSTIDAWDEELRFRYQERDKGLAGGANVTLSYERFTARVEWLTGDRTDNDVENPLKQRRGDASTFFSLWGVLAARFPVGGVVLMPAVRAEWLDIDHEHADVGAMLHLSAGFNVDLSPRTRLLLDLTRHYVQYGTRTWDYDIARYDADHVTGTLQLQLRI